MTKGIGEGGKPDVQGLAGEGGGTVRALPALALLTGSLVWSLVWYPYRALRDAGFDGLLSTTLTYSIAFTLALLVWRPKPAWPARPWLLLGLALAAGGCNVGYVLATLNGEVVRVLLLFFLAPLWTVLLARVLLGERLNRFGAFVILLSLAGASTMLWQPAAGLPLPRDVADWLGLGAGFCFALFNVLSRRARGLPVSQRLLVSFFGVAALGALLAMLFGVAALPSPATVPTGLLVLPLLVGALLLVTNFVVQFGLSNTPANPAIVIMLSEVGFAALSSWLLAGETIDAREWMGGAMIVAASLFSTRMNR